MKILQVESEGSKERFDAILAQFGFSGISPQTFQNTRTTSSRKVSHRESKTLEKEEENYIPDDRARQVKNRFYTFVVKKKHVKLQQRGGPFTIDPGTGVQVPNPQLLNERIKNPVFKSRYPRRENI